MQRHVLIAIAISTAFFPSGCEHDHVQEHDHVNDHGHHEHEHGASEEQRAEPLSDDGVVSNTRAGSSGLSPRRSQPLELSVDP